MEATSRLTPAHPRRARARVRVLALGLAVLPGLAACSSESASERIVESATGGEVDVDISDDGDSITYESDDGSITFGGSGEVPEEWPADVPLPDDLRIESSVETVTADGLYLALVAQVAESPEDVAALYADALSAWTEVSSITTQGANGELRSISYQDGERQLLVSVEDNRGSTTLTLTYLAPAS